jgi:hypothetical protein
MLRADLDRAMWNAYDWDDAAPMAVPKDTILARLLDRNLRRSVGETLIDSRDEDGATLLAAD